MVRVFGRKKTTNEQLTDEALPPAREGAKSRPTPKRPDQEAANRQPLVVADRKKAKAIDRDKRREQMNKTRQAMLTGDDTYLPPRDKGPVKRYVRDYVDARWNLAEFMLPVMVIVLAASFLRITSLFLAVQLMTYAILLIAIGDTVWMWLKLKKALTAKFGEGSAKGNGFYAVMRAFQMRRTRMPKPQVARGEYPS